MNIRTRFFIILEEGLAPRAVPARIMIGQRHAQLYRRFPEEIVFRRRIRFAAGKLVEFDAFEPDFGAVLELPHGVLDSRYQNDAHRDQPVRDRKSTRLNSSHVSESRMP